MLEAALAHMILAIPKAVKGDRRTKVEQAAVEAVVNTTRRANARLAKDIQGRIVLSLVERWVGQRVERSEAGAPLSEVRLDLRRVVRYAGKGHRDKERSNRFVRRKCRICSDR